VSHTTTTNPNQQKDNPMNNTNDKTQEVTQIGGLTRVTIGGRQAEAPASIQEFTSGQSKVHNGALRFALGDGEVTQPGVTRHAAGSASNSEGSVIRTMQNINGAQTVELIPGVAASRTHVSQAVADGLIEPVAAGIYRDVLRAAPADGGPAAPEEASFDPGAGVFNPQDDADWAADIEPLPQFAYDGATSSVIAAVLSGADNLNRAATQLAESAAIPVDLAAEYVTQGHAMYERVVAKEVASMGIGPEEKPAFYAWLRESKGRALHNAVQSLTTSRNVAPFKHLAAEFLTRAK